MGDLCCFEAAGGWHRGRIESAHYGERRVRNIDVGCKSVCLDSEIYVLSEEFSGLQPLVWLLRLWGLRPTGNGDKWARSACAWLDNTHKSANSYFVEVYSKKMAIVENLSFLTMKMLSVSGVIGNEHHVRLYYQFMQKGGPLQCNYLEFQCVNDILQLDGYGRVYYTPGCYPYEAFFISFFKYQLIFLI